MRGAAKISCHCTPLHRRVAEATKRHFGQKFAGYFVKNALTQGQPMRAGPAAPLAPSAHASIHRPQLKQALPQRLCRRGQHAITPLQQPQGAPQVWSRHGHATDL